MTVCGNPLSRSLSDVKRTCRFAAHMSAFDPKRTLLLPVGLAVPLRWAATSGMRATMRRRELVKLLGVVAAWPAIARAQQERLVIGYLSTLSEATAAPLLSAFRRGLGETGFLEGQNVTIEYRWAEGRYERLPAMAAELVRRPVSLILAQAPPAALSAKTATASIPIVFVVGLDPVGSGLVSDMNNH